MEKAAPTEGPKTATPALRVEEPEALGRRKRLAGKEGAASVQFEEVASTTSAVSERDVSEIGLGCNTCTPEYRSQPYPERPYRRLIDLQINLSRMGAT